MLIVRGCCTGELEPDEVQNGEQDLKCFKKKKKNSKYFFSYSKPTRLKYKSCARVKIVLKKRLTG